MKFETLFWKKPKSKTTTTTATTTKKTTTTTTTTMATTTVQRASRKWCENNRIAGLKTFLTNKKFRIFFFITSQTFEKKIRFLFYWSCRNEMMTLHFTALKCSISYNSKTQTTSTKVDSRSFSLAKQLFKSCFNCNRTDTTLVLRNCTDLLQFCAKDAKEKEDPYLTEVLNLIEREKNAGNCFQTTKKYKFIYLVFSQNFTLRFSIINHFKIRKNFLLQLLKRQRPN